MATILPFLEPNLFIQILLYIAFVVSTIFGLPMLSVDLPSM
jgi:hypothetical protein